MNEPFFVAVCRDCSPTPVRVFRTVRDRDRYADLHGSMLAHRMGRQKVKVVPRPGVLIGPKRRRPRRQKKQ